jgi:hypothetical protein
MNEEILAELRQQTKLLLQIASDLAEVKENTAASGAINHTHVPCWRKSRQRWRTRN